jgi:polysaccharide deacetylase 2 family uncharacterized protein YibQ
MRNFLMGGVKGLVVAGLGLGTASYLLPARVAAPSPPSAAAPETAAPETAASETGEQTAPAPVPPEAEPAPPAMPQVDPSAEPALAPNAEPSPAPSEALLDPAPEETTGAKVATPPQPGDALQTPTISADPAPDAPATDVPELATPVGLPPLQAFAAAFEGAGGKPLFAIVLLDTGAADIDRAVWASLPLPVSFAVDPDSPTAAEAMALYRAAGKEVIILPTSLPAGAQASDVETSLAAYQAMLPESVAVMSDPVSGFQDDRDLATLVVPAVGAQGRGVLLFDKGLNSAAQIAQRDGIPYAMISKIIDAGGESVPVMRRYLDRAVFKAAQDGAAVVMGQTLPDTLTALTEWSLEGRAGDVALAPISALMQPPQ